MASSGRSESILEGGKKKYKAAHLYGDQELVKRSEGVQVVLLPCSKVWGCQDKVKVGRAPELLRTGQG